jgi:2-polyprenyl-3-methyl-5-hydroxy-6-metoxy-1,4-benzoquinol methylase
MYYDCINSKFFGDLEEYSKQFIKKYESTLKDYSDRWVFNPFHQWSRQWEYPFTYSALSRSVMNSKKMNILDAGSGCTFFPFYLKNMIKSDIFCCDTDSALTPIFESINHNEKSIVKFDNFDIRELGYISKFFDIIYCISVMEHTQEHSRILNEFRRVLSPHGLLVLTFDITLTKSGIREALDLMKIMSLNFDPVEDCSIPKGLLQERDILSTTYMRKVDKTLLPYAFQHSFFRQMLQIKRPMPKITVHCSLWKKRN